MKSDQHFIPKALTGGTNFLGQKSKSCQVLGSQDLGKGQEKRQSHVSETEKTQRNEFQPYSVLELEKARSAGKSNNGRWVKTGRQGLSWNRAKSKAR